MSGLKIVNNNESQNNKNGTENTRFRINTVFKNHLQQVKLNVLELYLMRVKNHDFMELFSSNGVVTLS